MTLQVSATRFTEVKVAGTNPNKELVAVCVRTGVNLEFGADTKEHKALYRSDRSP